MKAKKATPILLRAGAVARMLQMPATTLRVWERRYGLTQSRLSPSGHRLYSDSDVHRLALIKSLTDRGHAIGRLAGLGMADLRRIAATHSMTVAASQSREAAKEPSLPSARPWRIAVVGAALAERLQRRTLLRRIGVPVSVCGVFKDVAQAAAALRGVKIDAMLYHEPHVHEGWLDLVDAAAPSLAAVQKLVLFGLATDAVCEALATAGVALLRDPQPDAVIAQCLRNLVHATRARQPAHQEAQWSEPAPARRWDDAALVSFSQLSSTVACECPRHVAELLIQLARFESYSAECEDRNASDAELHHYLRQVASSSRARFERVLEHVALHEGLILPAFQATAAVAQDDH